MSTPVVTGIGLLAPNGVGLAGYWAATLDGRSGIGPIGRFDAGGYPNRLAGEVSGFDPDELLSARLLPQTDRMTRYALLAADWALADAGLDPATVPPEEFGVITAGAAGGFEFGQRELEKLWSRGPGHVSTYMSFAWFYAVNAGQISIRHGARGSSGVLVADQAGGIDALAQAARRVHRGLRVALTGGMDASLCPYGMVSHLTSGRLSDSGDPRAAYLPFAEGARGFVPGEGGAILTVEDADAAAARGVTGYGHIVGYGATFDPAPGTGRPATLLRAAELALAEADASPGDIALVLADAAATPELDRIEAVALRELFGPYGVPVTAPKTMTGRLYSGAGPVDVATALLALRHGTAPPTINVAVPRREYEIDLVVGRPRPVTGDTALVLARGAGGFNSAMVVRGTARQDSERTL